MDISRTSHPRTGIWKKIGLVLGLFLFAIPVFIVNNFDLHLATLAGFDGSMYSDRGQIFISSDETRRKAPYSIEEPRFLHWKESWRKSPPTIYICIKGGANGMKENKNMMSDVLPEYQFDDLSRMSHGNKLYDKMPNKYLDANYTNEYDIFIVPYSMGCTPMVLKWMMTHYNGHIVLFSGESHAAHPIQVNDPEKLHVFGPVNNGRPQDLALTYMQLTWWTLFKDALSPSVMTDYLRRPRGEKTHFMIYANSNCVEYREEAVGKLSELGLVHCDGKCQGQTPQNGSRTNLQKVQNGIGLMNWWDNTKLFSKYRFCFVMEHSKSPAYITEKIIMAFIGGCIPIYYGLDIILDIFNEKAFVYYNISDPQPALDQVKALEADETLYEKMMNEPIVAHGQSTIEKYFSFNDTVGNGQLKKKMRKKLGLTHLVP